MKRRGVITIPPPRPRLPVMSPMVMEKAENLMIFVLDHFTSLGRPDSALIRLSVLRTRPAMATQRRQITMKNNCTIQSRAEHLEISDVVPFPRSRVSATSALKTVKMRVTLVNWQWLPSLRIKAFASGER